jgi:5-methylthioadenosine/S-adenosylhomocysteine deaminase
VPISEPSGDNRPGGTVLSGGTVLTANAADELLDAADLRIEGAGIVEIGAAGTLARPGDRVIDCRDTLITPGLVNVHTHAATGFYRGLAEDAPRDFWAGRYAVPGQERFTIEDHVLSATASAAEFLLNGVTTIADRLGSMDRVAPALEASGIRAVVGHSISDRDGAPDWKTVEAVVERFGVDPARRVFAGLAPHALDTCSDALLKECARRAERLGCSVFIHVAQSAPEVAAVRARGHLGALACLRATGLTGGRVVAAHGIYLGEDEIVAWPESGIALAHCPASNLKIEARTLPIYRLLGAVPIGLGTDWTVTNNAMDLLSEARLAALVGKLIADDPEVITIRDMVRMLTIDGARVLGLDGLVGSIEPGKRADLVVFDLTRLEANPWHDLAANLIHAMSVRTIRDVFVDGEMLVREGRLTRLDERALARQVRRLGRN